MLLFDSKTTENSLLTVIRFFCDFTKRATRRYFYIFLTYLRNLPKETPRFKKKRSKWDVKCLKVCRLTLAVLLPLLVLTSAVMNKAFSLTLFTRLAQVTISSFICLFVLYYLFKRLI